MTGRGGRDRVPPTLRGGGVRAFTGRSLPAWHDAGRGQGCARATAGAGQGLRWPMTVLSVTHRTTYRYRRPVRFGEHRLMVRPRDSHDLRLLDTTMDFSPPARVRWLHDTFSNSIALARFPEPASELVVRSHFRARHYPLTENALELEPYARRLPFEYTDEDRADLGRLLDRHHPEDDGVAAWARDLLAEPGMRELDTAALMAAMTRRIRAFFRYRRREEAGTQAPAETLRLGTGSCRDYALFMMEAARSLGLAARYVSGYLYDDRLATCDEAGGGTLTGGGATHAWVQVFLPGAGWVEFDPTNGLVGGRNLIRVAVTRDPSQAIPVSGTFLGARTDYLGMEVEVRVTVLPGAG